MPQDGDFVERSRLVGTWRRRTSDACAARYPRLLQLTADGLYTGTADAPGSFTLWDAGTWRLARAGVVELSVANDGVEAYAVAVAEAEAIFVDAAGCVFTFTRGD